MAQSDRCKEGTLITNTFISTAPRAHLCESWMRENCTSSLSGGRRLAFGRLLRPDRVGDGEEPESQPKARTVFREELEREE